MRFASRRKIYDRTRILQDAERARTRRQWRRAIALYRRVLAAEPRNADLHRRVAPLLARTGQHFDAWRSFEHAARANLEAGRADQALAIYREAAKRLPRSYEAWRSIAELELHRRQPERAREALLEGGARMRGRRRRPEAIALLRAARDLAPQDAGTALDLARLLARSRQQCEARDMLVRVAAEVDGRARRRVCGLLWRLDPSLRHGFAWIRAAWQARGDRRGRVTRRARVASSRA